MRNVLGIGIAAVCFLGAFAGVAFAEPEALIDLAKPVLSAILSGQYAYAAALALVLAVAAARRYGGARFPFLRSDAGGASLALVGGIGGALVNSLAAGGGVSLALLWSALLVAVGAAGGYSLIKRLIVTPILEPLAARAPAPIRAVLGVILWAFRSNAAADATAAGNAAVVASPSSGVAGIVGEPRDFMGGQ